jgi:DNA polymerase III epsilon subunit-like protein
MFPGGNHHVFVGLDVETTGLSPGRDRIVQLGLVTAAEDLSVLWEGAVLIDPGCVIPPATTSIHGISTADVKGALTFDSIAEWVAGIVATRRVIGHNLGFDLGFLEAEFGRIGRGLPEIGERIDTLQMARTQLKGYSSYALSNVCRALGVTLERPHDACFDAICALEIYRALVSGLG